MSNSKHRIADKQLLSRFKSGDEDAFNMVYTRFREPLVQFLYKIIGSRDDAEDICQDTFATLWQKHDTIDPDKRINTFIFLIAKQLTWKYIDRNRHADDLHAGTVPESNLDLSPEEIVQSQEMDMLVRYAIDKLPPRTAEIFNLHCMEGLSYSEIAGQLNINTDNVKAKIYLARAKIREIIMTAMLFLTV